MPAEAQRAPVPEAEQPPAPAQEAARPPSFNEALTGVPTPETPRGPGSLREKETRLEQEGMAKLNEMGKNLNVQAEASAQEFGEKTKSWWNRAKGIFKKKEAEAVKGEAEILSEIEKADAVFAEFRKKAAEIMASGDADGLRMLERSLSKSYDELAPKVAAEVAAEASAMKRALKTGEMPPITEAGAKLNYVAKRLSEVRGRMSGGAAPAPEAAPARPAAEQPKGQPAEAPKAEAAPEIDGRESLLKGRALNDGTTVKGFEGTPAAAMVDTYIERTKQVGTTDRHGEIVGVGIGSRKTRDGSSEGAVTTKYDDGKERVETSSGRELIGMPGGLMKDVKPQAQIVEEPFFNEAERAELKEAETQMLAEESMDARGEFEVKPAAESAAEAAGVTVSADYAKDIERATPKTPESASEVSGEIETRPEASESAAPAEEPGAPVTEGAGAMQHESKEGPRAMSLGELVEAVRTWERNSMFDGGVAEKFFKEHPDLGEKHAHIRMDADAQMANIVQVSEYLRRIALNAAPGEAAESVLQHKREEMESKKTGATPQERTLIDDEERLLSMTARQLEAAEGLKAKHGAPAIVIYPSPEAPMEPEASVETPPAVAPEKNEFPADKLQAGMGTIAEKQLLPKAQASGAPKTYGKVVAGMAAAEFLKLFVDEGKISGEEAASLAEEFKSDPEEFNKARKKLVTAINKLTR
ncbi:MAG: hypothetical protein AAB554_00020 [Patescibacteria group bacterium]